MEESSIFHSASIILFSISSLMFMVKNSDDKFVHHFSHLLYYISIHFSQNTKLCFSNYEFDKYRENLIMYRLSLPKILGIADNKVL